MRFTNLFQVYLMKDAPNRPSHYKLASGKNRQEDPVDLARTRILPLKNTRETENISSVRLGKNFDSTFCCERNRSPL